MAFDAIDPGVHDDIQRSERIKAVVTAAGVDLRRRHPLGPVELEL